MHVHACRCGGGGREGVGLLFNCFKRPLSVNQPTTIQRSKTGAGETVHQKLLKLSDLAVHMRFATGCTSGLNACTNAWMHALGFLQVIWEFAGAVRAILEGRLYAQVRCCCSEVFFSLNLRVLTSNSILPKLSIDRGHYPSAAMDQCVFLGSQK